MGMAGKSPVVATQEQIAALETMAAGCDRAEADRARAILLTLRGWTSPRLAEAFSVREDTVRFWRSEFMAGGVSALETRPLPGPAPLKTPTPPVVLVLDNGPIHVSKASRAALAERAHWLTVEWLPKYAPELNDIEIVWGDLKARHLAHRTFTDVDSLDSVIHHAVTELNSARYRHPLAKQRISAALSREPEFATRSPEVTARAHAAVAARHVRNASSLRTRSVLRDVRWR
jgi:transposase